MTESAQETMAISPKGGKTKQLSYYASFIHQSVSQSVNKHSFQLPLGSEQHTLGAGVLSRHTTTTSFFIDLIYTEMPAKETALSSIYLHIHSNNHIGIY